MILPVGQLGLSRPLLAVIVDTEEEFDWSRPFDRSATRTDSVTAQDRAQIIFDRLGVVPTYLVDFPVATCSRSASYLRQLLEAGKVEIGTQCHPWVTPPFSETVSTYNSFLGNLPEALAASKITTSTTAVSEAFGVAPKIFKAGRYGIGSSTFSILRSLGYQVDCSLVPYTTYAYESGPDFRQAPSDVFFTDKSRTLLEVPLTVGFGGPLSGIGSRHPAMMVSDWAQRLRIPGILGRLGLMDRARLSPEGFELSTQKRLLASMVRQGVRIFTLTYHSPSLVPGNTPYVRTATDLVTFLGRIEGVLSYFKNRLGGEFTTMTKIHDVAQSCDLTPMHEWTVR